jgi:hypothetical protein
VTDETLRERLAACYALQRAGLRMLPDVQALAAEAVRRGLADDPRELAPLRVVLDVYRGPVRPQGVDCEE